MKKFSLILKMEKRSSPVIMVIILTICITLIGCSNLTEQLTDEISPDTAVISSDTTVISSDLRNTTWTKQITDMETITISFGRNRLTMTSNVVPSEYNQEWDYLGGSCCGNGYCSFYNGQSSLEFRYRCYNNGLNITNSNVRSLNGSWTKK